MKKTTALSFFICVLMFFSRQLTAQTVIQPAATDTIRIIQILQGKSLRERIVDTTSFQTIAGNVILQEGLTTFSCDSAIINKTTNVLEAFGNIHINQQDSIHTYSKYLKYVGKERMAYLKKDVRLTDKKGTLYTQELQYDLKSSVGTYTKGGRVVNGKTILTSDNGVYYAETKDVFFKNNVHLVDPKYDIRSDSLQYNTQTQVVNFITATQIKTKDGGEVYTKSGSYDLKNGKAFFGARTIFKDSTRTYVSDASAIDEASGIAQLEGNAVIKDSVNGYSVLGGQIFLNKKNSSFLATRKPVLIFKGDGNDSTFVAADTLFSGIEHTDSAGVVIKGKTDTLKQTLVIKQDKGGKTIVQKIEDSAMAVKDNLSTAADTLAMQETPDSLQGGNDDLAITKNNNQVISVADSTVKPNLPKSIANHSDEDSVVAPNAVTKQVDSTLQDSKPELSRITKDTTKNANDTIRYFQAFHNVRIYNDSLQSVCDSLYYTSRDSVFRLYKDPLVFANNSQIAGDTIHLYTKNKKADRIYVFDNGIIINEVKKDVMYNQMAGRTLNGYFKEGAIDYMRVKGSPAESIFYPQDKDSAFTGMNRARGDVIDIYFVDKAVNRVKFINDVNGTFFPIKQIPNDQKQLAKFQWLDKRRPKNKFELFE